MRLLVGLPRMPRAVGAPGPFLEAHAGATHVEAQPGFISYDPPARMPE